MTKVIPPEISRKIEKRLEKKGFEGYAALHSWVKDNYLPDIKYGTLSQSIRRHYDNPALPPKPQQLKVKEHVTELKKLLPKHRRREQKRIQMLMEVKKGKITTMKELGDVVGVNVFTLRIWFGRYREGGIKKLLHSKN